MPRTERNGTGITFPGRPCWPASTADKGTSGSTARFPEAGGDARLPGSHQRSDCDSSSFGRERRADPAWMLHLIGCNMLVSPSFVPQYTLQLQVSM